MENQSLSRASSPAEIEPFHFSEEFAKTDSPFTIRVKANDICLAPEVILFDSRDGSEHSLPFEIFEALDAGRVSDITTKLKESRENYKIQYADIQKKFGLYPKPIYNDRKQPDGTFLYTEYSVETPEERKSSPRSIRLIFLPFYSSSPKQANQKNISSGTDSLLGSWVLAYNSNIILSAAWNDREGVARAVEVMRDTEACEALFALVTP